MPKARLTDISLRSIRAPDIGQVTYWDETLPTFGIRVSQGGSRTFVIQKSGRRTVVGRYPTLSLSQARTEAKRLLAEMTLGKIRPPSKTLQELVDLFSRPSAHRKTTSRAPFRATSAFSIGISCHVLVIETLQTSRRTISLRLLMVCLIPRLRLTRHM